MSYKQQFVLYLSYMKEELLFAFPQSAIYAWLLLSLITYIYYAILLYVRDVDLLWIFLCPHKFFLTVFAYSKWPINIGWMYF